MQQGLEMPTIHDLGALDGPVLVFGGPYGNLEAMTALLARARWLGIPPSRMICTGDVVAYCADPQACVDLIRHEGIPVVMGNCEESLATGAADCGCGFAPGSACDLLSAQWFRCADRDLDADSREWMGRLPRALGFMLAGRRLRVIHGGVAQINRFIFASATVAELDEELDAAGVDGVIAGHCGLPFTRVIGGRLWHNAGVAGMPANDGTPRVWFSLLIPSPQGIMAEHHALTYDHEAAAKKMSGRGYPDSYAQALCDGLWPSCDILPQVERQSRGRPIPNSVVHWSSIELSAAAE
jgi:predicted phosphodiesterase